MLRAVPFVLTTVCAFASLCGCGNAISYSPAMPSAAATATEDTREGSWVTPDAKATDLLYVAADVKHGSTYSNVVLVYSYPSGKHVGTLTGFVSVDGLCSDAKGNVWVLDYATDKLVKYAHGGAKPIATISQNNAAPHGCAVDPVTGNLAVANASPPNVLIYKNAGGTPTTYTDSDIANYMFSCSYDSQGNLFVTGEGSGNFTGYLAVLPKNGSKLQTLGLNEPINGVIGNVQWDGKYAAVEYGGAIFRFAISGKHGQLAGTTALQWPYSGAEQVTGFWISPAGSKTGPFAQQLVASGTGSSGPGGIALWHYPAGGGALRPLGGSASYQAVTVSTVQ